MVHIALVEVITNKKLLKDLEKLTEFHHTGELESYHSLMTKYAPKREHFCYNGMVARTQLAVLDHNANVNRTQAEVKKGSKQGEKRFKIVCGKQRKNWLAKEIKTPKFYSYVEGMMNDVILCKKGKQFKYKPKIQAKCIAPTPKPPKQDVIEKRISKYYLQHERPCCIGYTNSSRRREFVYPIQHGRECCKQRKKRFIL
jgi:hypothetical protein